MKKLFHFTGFGNADIDKLAKDMNNLIWSRKIPLEKDELLEKLEEMENIVMNQGLIIFLLLKYFIIKQSNLMKSEEK